MTDLILPLENRYLDYLTDESEIRGTADTISFPETEAQVQQIVKVLAGQKIPITVQGSRTGFSGRAVPVCGHILNLSAMKKVMGLEQDESGQFLIRVQPGLSLLDLDRQLYARRFDLRDGARESLSVLEAFKKLGRRSWPPDPTESHASIGGIAATNARGICFHAYGPARHHVRGIRIVDASGDVRSIEQERFCFSDDIPGVITELLLDLIPKPSEIWGIVFFSKDRFKAVEFAEAMGRGSKTGSEAVIAGIQFMNQTTLMSINDYKKKNHQPAHLPDIDSKFSAAVYAELHSHDPHSVETLAEFLMKTAAGFNCDPDDSWAFSGEHEVNKLHDFCHAAQASVLFQMNTAHRLDPRITRTGIAIHCREGGISKALDNFEKDICKAGLKAAAFGHAADGCLQMNILPKDYRQFIKAKALLEKWTSAGNPNMITGNQNER